MIAKKITSINKIAEELYKYSIKNEDTYLEEKSLQIIKDINFIDELSKESVSSLVVENTQESEIKKVKRKIPLWMKRQHQYNYIILATYMKISHQNTQDVLLKDLEIESGLTAILFYRHYNLMKNIFDKNHAKVFEEQEGSVCLWKPVAQYIESIFNEGQCNVR